MTSEDKLLTMAIQFGTKQFRCGAPIETSSGKCAIGLYGAANFSLLPERCFGQVWFLTDCASVVVLATYMSVDVPDPVELVEVHRIVSNIKFEVS